MYSLEQELKGNSYPGRGIVIGKSKDGKYAVTASGISVSRKNVLNAIPYRVEIERRKQQCFGP